MNAREQGFLLLTSQLGNPDRRPLTAVQLRILAERVQSMPREAAKRELESADLKAIGYGGEMAARILELLSEQELLKRYLLRGRKSGCAALTRASSGYPAVVRQRLGLDSPGCIWAKGDLSILQMPKIGLVGSRELDEANSRFAAEAGRQAALQGYALVSGNARGADRTAQSACLRAGGKVISVVADELETKSWRKNIVYLSEDGFDLAFSSQRALSRNRLIHSLGSKTLVAQSHLGSGGTWSGTVKNLHEGWSPVYAFDDGSGAMAQLGQMGAQLIGLEMLAAFDGLPVLQNSLFDQS